MENSADKAAQDLDAATAAANFAIEAYGPARWQHGRHSGRLLWPQDKAEILTRSTILQAVDPAPSDLELVIALTAAGTVPADDAAARLRGVVQAWELQGFGGRYLSTAETGSVVHEAWADYAGCSVELVARERDGKCAVELFVRLSNN